MRLERITWKQAERYFKDPHTAVIPIGSIENHGSHLTLGTDFLIPSHLTGAIEKKCDVLIVPAVPYGVADHHFGFPGTISLGYDGLRLVLEKITDCLYRYGVRRFVFLNGHGGNDQAILDTALQLEDKGALGALLNWWQLAGELNPKWKGGHGGGEETAESLAHFRNSSRHLIGWIFSGIWSLCVLAWVLPFFHGKTRGWSLLTMAALFLVAVLVFFLTRNRKKGAKEERQRRQWVLHRADDRRLGVCRPFPGEKKPVEKWNHIGGSFWIALLLALPVVAWMVSDGRSAGRLMQNLLLYLPFAALPLQQVLSATGAGRAAGELRSLLPRAKKKPGGQATLPSLGSVMEWKDVTFSYPDSAQPVLQGVSLRLNPGDRVGIYGGTGAGKTTFCRLAAGLQRPTGGNIYYGGVELGRYNGAALRSRVAWETGRDIVLGSTLPSQADGRTFVVLSPRMEDLRGCQRIYRLEEGRLIPVDEKQIG